MPIILLRLLHFMGLTNLSDEIVQKYRCQKNDVAHELDLFRATLLMYMIGTLATLWEAYAAIACYLCDMEYERF